MRARTLRAQIDELCLDAQLEILYKSVEKEHQARYPRLMGLRLNAIWLCFYVILVVLGIGLFLMTFLFSF